MSNESLSLSDYGDRVRERIIDCARMVLAGTVEPLPAVRKLSGLLAELNDPQLETARIALVGIDSQTDHLPLGAVRENWAPEALVAQDREITEASELFRNEISETCRALLNFLERAA